MAVPVAFLGHNRRKRPTSYEHLSFFFKQRYAFHSVSLRFVFVFDAWKRAIRLADGAGKAETGASKKRRIPSLEFVFRKSETWGPLPSWEIGKSILYSIEHVTILGYCVRRKVGDFFFLTFVPYSLAFRKEVDVLLEQAALLLLTSVTWS